MSTSLLQRAMENAARFLEHLIPAGRQSTRNVSPSSTRSRRERALAKRTVSLNLSPVKHRASPSLKTASSADAPVPIQSDEACSSRHHHFFPTTDPTVVKPAVSRTDAGRPSTAAVPAAAAFHKSLRCLHNVHRFRVTSRQMCVNDSQCG